ncbi:VanW family protein [Vallitalea guaymasensis]|uniref:VanW family protein n=1 Tax=Vallitalea guaymasensis TaxID=1185412 RepID=UPI000DE51FA9|nr:VanW family protein [Vallitalea guaymasensis]
MEEPKNNKKKRKWLLVTIITIIVVIVALACYFFIRYKNMEKVVKRDVIYEGISIEGIDIGGLSKEEALDKMKVIIDEKIFDKEIKISYEDKIYTKPYNYFEFKSNYKEIVDKAYNLFKTGKLKERYNKINKLKEDKIDYSVENVYNEEKIKEFVSSIKNDFNIEPKNAIIHRKNSEFIIDKEVNGLKLNVDTNVANLKNAIDNFKQELELVVEVTKPKYTKEYYSNIKEVIGEYSTAHNNNEARTQNLRIACNKINGTILYPGQDFATHVAISPISSKNGYREAPIIISGEVKDGLGGGICQVATTLYNAVLMAELKVIERQNHSMPVSYIEKGKDATMSGSHVDFVFENSSNYPIYIESYVYGGKLCMRLFGNDERNSSRKIKFQSEIIQKISPPKATYITDSSLAPGAKVTKRKAINGYKVKLYKLIYVNDKLTDKQLVNTSYYKPVGAIIRVGKKKVAESNEPVETMEATNVIEEEETVETLKTIDDDEKITEDTVKGTEEMEEEIVEDIEEDIKIDIEKDVEEDIEKNIEDSNSDDKLDNNSEEELEKAIDDTVSIQEDSENIEDMEKNEEATDEGVDKDEAGKSTGDST